MAYQTPVLLHFDGTNGSTSYPNDNKAGPTFANVPSGVAALTTTSPQIGSARLAGGNDNSLGGVVSNKPIYIPRRTDFSIEGRFQTANNAFNGFVFSIGDLSLNPRSIALRLNSAITSSGDLRLFIGGQQTTFSAAGSVVNATPLAYGVFRCAGVIYLTIDGALQGVWADNGDLGGGNFYVGNVLDGGALAGIGSSYGFFHDEVRVTIGLARQKRFPYTVATTAFVLDGQPGPTVQALAKKRERTLFGATQSAAAYTLSIDPATYTLTAAAETLLVARALSISPASYALTASAVTLSVGRVLSVSPASYALTTSPETLVVARALSIDPASYVISAPDVTLTYASLAKQLAIDPASYTLTASAVTMTATRALSIDPASYAVTPSAITLSVGRQLDVSAASYSITPSPVTLTTARSLNIEPASYIITTPDIGLTYTPAGSIDYEQLAAAVWAYTLSNGKTAEQTLVENNDMLEALSALPNLDTPIEGAFSSADLLRVIAAVAAGKTSIDSASPGTATVEFRDVNDTENRVSADMVGSERASVTINP